MLTLMFRLASVVLLAVLSAAAQNPPAQQPARPPRPPAPTRDPHTAGYVDAKELPDGENAPAKADGNFIIGPTHTAAPESAAREGVPNGDVYSFVWEST